MNHQLTGAPPSQPDIRQQDASVRTGSFTSNLSTAEFAAVRSVGFSPLALVMGTVVAAVSWVNPACGYYSQFAAVAPQMLADREQALTDLRAAALRRMRDECVALRADGVVGVRLALSPFPARETASTGRQGWEFMATGTAVRADGPVRPHTPFTCDLSAQEFATLLRSGWVPASLVQGVSAKIRHQDIFQEAAEQSGRNNEIPGASALVAAARSAARTTLIREAAACGAGYVAVREQTLQTYEMTCKRVTGRRDGVAEAYFSGTAMVPIGRDRPTRPPATLPIMRLDRTGFRGDS